MDTLLITDIENVMERLAQDFAESPDNVASYLEGLFYESRRDFSGLVAYLAQNYGFEVRDADHEAEVVVDILENLDVEARFGYHATSRTLDAFCLGESEEWIPIEVIAEELAVSPEQVRQVAQEAELLSQDDCLLQYHNLEGLVVEPVNPGELQDLLSNYRQ